MITGCCENVKIFAAFWSLIQPTFSNREKILVNVMRKNMKIEQKSKNSNGIYLVLIAAMLFSIGGLCIKMVPWSPLAINGARSLISVMVLATYLKIIKHKIVINRAVLFGAVCMTGTTSLFCVANKLTTAANAIVLQFTAPIFVILLMWVLKNEKPKKLDILACVVVFSGIICFFVDGLLVGNMIGNSIAVLSGICYAGVFMMNSFEKSDAISSVFLGHALSAVTGIGFVFGETDFGSQAIIGIILLGVFQMAIAYIFMSKGLEQVSAITASLTTAIEPILNPLLVAFFWGEMISPLSLVGAAMVIVGVIGYTLIKENK